MADGQRPADGRIDPGHGRQRHHFPGQRRAQVEVIEAFGLAALLRVDFQNHVVLVGLGLELIDLALTEGVVQCFIDIGGGQAKARRRITVNADMGDAAPQLQVVGQISKGRIGAQFFGQALGPGGERRTIVALEHILILTTTGARAEVDILAGTQVQHDARHLGQLRANAVDKFAGRHVALAAVLEGNPEAAVGDGLVAAGHAHGMGERLHGRVVADDLGQRQMLLRHVRE